MSQAKHPTPHQDRDSKQGHHPDDAQEGPPEPAYATAYDHGNQDYAGQQRPPLLVVGVDTEQNQAVLFGDEGPAGANRDPAFMGVGGVEVGANERAEERRAGTEGVRTCRSGWKQYNEKKIN